MSLSTPDVPQSASDRNVMLFDGQNSVVSIGHTFPAMAAGVTIEFWAWGAEELPRSTSVFSARKANGEKTLNIHLPWSDSNIYWDAGGDGCDRIQKAADPGDFKGAWKHWAFVKDCAKGDMAIYRDGALWHHGDCQLRTITESVVAVAGAYVDDNYKWIGRLAELRIWDRPRTGEEIAADRGHRLTGKEPGLISYWPLNRVDSDGSTPDLAGNRAGTVVGATIVPDDALPVAPVKAEPATCLPQPEPAMAHVTVEPGPGPEPAPAPEPVSQPAPAPASASDGASVDGQAGAAPSVLLAVLRFNEGRKPSRVRLKLKRMASDPFAFFRGADHLYADAWPGLKPPDAGPAIPLCGDLHLENFGAYRDDHGEFLYDITDFDEAVVAPCSVDLVRCATSILLAGEIWRLTPLQASGMVLTFLDKYRATVTGAGSVPHAEVDPRAPKLARGPIWDLLGKFAVADQAELLDQHAERLRDGTRRILRSKTRHPAIRTSRGEAIRDAVEAYGAATGRADVFKTLDVTGRVAGIGSLGLKRYTILVAGGGTPKTNRLFDLKECRPSSLAACASQRWPFADDTDAARVVQAQRMLQACPTAGLDVLKVGDTAYRFREMIPEENRTSLERFNKKPQKLAQAIEQAGLLTALAHLRGAKALPEPVPVEALSQWAAGPALDSVLAAAARFAEHTRKAHQQFCSELRSPRFLPQPLRKRFCR
jgi:uncharacterized protein (DUF2252 family)